MNVNELKVELTNDLEMLKKKIEKANMWPMSWEQGMTQKIMLEFAIQQINKLDNLEYNRKVKVPKKFDEWYKQIDCESYNTTKTEIACYLISRVGWGYALNASDENESVYDSQLQTWVANNKDLAIKAILNDYEVQEEPKYRVMIPNPNSKSTQSCWCLRKNEGNEKITIVKNAIDTFYKSEYGELTESEIKKDFDWAFQFAEPVE